MATEANLTYLGRLFINQYVFKLDVRLQRLCCSADTAIAAAPATPTVPTRECGQQRHLWTLEKSDRSLADAEVGEDVAEEVVGADFAGDFAEVVHGLTDVLRYEVARQVNV